MISPDGKAEESEQVFGGKNAKVGVFGEKNAKFGKKSGFDTKKNKAI